jgi:SAM-dependent methyltransferase
MARCAIHRLAMKNPEHWHPTKYVYRNNRLRASRDREHVAIGSRLAADLTAAFYDKHLRNYARGRLLDLGCGDVPLYQAYRDLVADVTCADWKNTPHDARHLDIECDLSAALPFKEGEFDTIILSDVLEHVPEPAALCREMARILAPGGTLIMNVPFLYGLHEKPHDYYRYTEFALRRLIGQAGLNIVLLEASGGSPVVHADFLAKHLQFIPLLGPPLAMFVQWCAALVISTAPGHALSRKTAEHFPFGYFVVAQKHVAGRAKDRSG